MTLNENAGDQGQPDAPDDSSTLYRRISDLTRLVGDRLREARKIRGLSRRELSERSGVSQRYLAQVEAGEGNISVALLLKVGDALDRRIEWFVDESDRDLAEARHVAELYTRANETDQRAIDAILAPYRTGSPRARRIALIGLRGAGKSTLGRRISKDLAIPFIELNDEVEAQSGMPVADVMALYGQEGYRTLERKALGRVVGQHESLILAAAGGIVGTPETFELLLEQFHTVWLRAAPHEHMERVRAQGDERPMAGNPSAMDDLREILRSREALYTRANAELDTSGQNEDATLAKLHDLVVRHGFLNDT